LLPFTVLSRTARVVVFQGGIATRETTAIQDGLVISAIPDSFAATPLSREPAPQEEKVPANASRSEMH
jgi:hypothetical protein